jgi:putative hydrolase of the HAD superfamily
MVKFKKNLHLSGFPAHLQEQCPPSSRRALLFQISPTLAEATMPLRKYKAVFFDVGGTLLQVYPSVGDVYAKHARAFGFQGDAAELTLRFRDAWKRLGGLESLGTQTGPAAERRFWYDLVWDVFRHHPLSDFDSYFATVYQAFESKDAWHVYDDVAQSGILTKLKTRGAVLGVVSNWDSRLKPILANTGLAAHFDFILASAVVGSAKPDAGIFREALRLSGVRAEEACHIGDEPHTDIRGARNLGIDSILIDRTGRHPGAETAVVSSFLELV